jgi:hypothetical protein
MQTRHLALALAATAAFACSVMAGPMGHSPHLQGARQDAEHAIAKLKQAQQANEYDLGGHAHKAEELLTQAIAEMKLAAEEKK